MAPGGATLLLSPAELSYLKDSLSQTPPIRPDGRTVTQFRPLLAETDILPSTNGSARVCFSDGSEAIVGIKAEVQRSRTRRGVNDEDEITFEPSGDADDDRGDEQNQQAKQVGESSWVEMSIDMPGYRDDDGLPIFLAQLLTEALVSSGDLQNRLYINRRYHWKLFIDVLLLSPPLSYPLPLLSITTHLALLNARLPRLKSEQDEDPLFNDDWEAAHLLYPISPTSTSGDRLDRPPITLLAAAVGQNYVFDPSKEELAAADAVIALSVASTATAKTGVSAKAKGGRNLRLVSSRMIDAPARYSSAGVVNAVNTATGGTAPADAQEAFALRELAVQRKDVWTPPRGGIKRKVLASIIEKVLEAGGVADEVLDALVGVQS